MRTFRSISQFSDLFKHKFITFSKENYVNNLENNFFLRIILACFFACHFETRFRAMDNPSVGRNRIDVTCPELETRRFPFGKVTLTARRVYH